MNANSGYEMQEYSIKIIYYLADLTEDLILVFTQL